MSIYWNPSLELGMEPVDSQHKQLMMLINTLQEARRCGKSLEQVFAALTAMKRYAAEHFLDEEAIMEEHDYTGIEAHRKEHAKFIEQVADYEEAAMADYAPFQDMLEYLSNWWVQHIGESDRAFIDSIR